MVKFQATALVHSISPVIQVSERFQKRELILDDSWEKDGNRYSNFVLVEFTGDKMAQLDYYAPGQRVDVEGLINGREYNGRIYNTVKGQTIAPHQAQGQYAAPAPAPAPIPGGYPQQSQYPQAAPIPGYASQPAAPAYPQQPQYSPAPAPAPATTAAPPAQQPYGQHHSPGVADLPFPH